MPATAKGETEACAHALPQDPPAAGRPRPASRRDSRPRASTEWGKPPQRQEGEPRQACALRLGIPAATGATRLVRKSLASVAVRGGQEKNPAAARGRPGRVHVRRLGSPQRGEAPAGQQDSHPRARAGQGEPPQRREGNPGECPRSASGSPTPTKRLGQPGRAQSAQPRGQGSSKGETWANAHAQPQGPLAAGKPQPAGDTPAHAIAWGRGNPAEVREELRRAPVLRIRVPNAAGETRPAGERLPWPSSVTPTRAKEKTHAETRGPAGRARMRRLGIPSLQGSPGRPSSRTPAPTRLHGAG